MGTEKLSGIVIREQVKGESNKQIVLLAKGVGRVVLSARGARKANSRLLAATQLFCYADFVVHEGNGFTSINQAELQKSFYDLRTDIDKFSEAMFDNQQTWSLSKNPKAIITGYASLLGMSENQINACLSDKALMKTVTQQRNNLADMYGVTGMPSVVVVSDSARKLLVGTDKDEILSEIRKRIK